MATLLEMATDIVSAHVSTYPLSKEDLLKEIQEVHAALVALEKGETIPTAAAPAAEAEEEAPAISKRKAFGKTSITCMICGKSMKTLARHLATEHDLKPGQYRKMFDIPRTQPLAAKDYSESRRAMAIERGLGENLAKARAARGKGKKASTKKTTPAPETPAATEA